MKRQQLKTWCAITLFMAAASMPVFSWAQEEFPKLPFNVNVVDYNSRTDIAPLRNDYYSENEKYLGFEVGPVCNIYKNKIQINLNNPHQWSDAVTYDWFHKSDIKFVLYRRQIVGQGYGNNGVRGNPVAEFTINYTDETHKKIGSINLKYPNYASSFSWLLYDDPYRQGFAQSGICGDLGLRYDDDCPDLDEEKIIYADDEGNVTIDDYFVESGGQQTMFFYYVGEFTTRGVSDYSDDEGNTPIAPAYYIANNRSEIDFVTGSEVEADEDRRLPFPYDILSQLFYFHADKAGEVKKWELLRYDRTGRTNVQVLARATFDRFDMNQTQDKQAVFKVEKWDFDNKQMTDQGYFNAAVTDKRSFQRNSNNWDQTEPVDNYGTSYLVEDPEEDWGILKAYDRLTSDDVSYASYVLLVTTEKDGNTNTYAHEIAGMRLPNLTVNSNSNYYVKSQFAVNQQGDRTYAIHLNLTPANEEIEGWMPGGWQIYEKSLFRVWRMVNDDENTLVLLNSEEAPSQYELGFTPAGTVLGDANSNLDGVENIEFWDYVTPELKESKTFKLTYFVRMYSEMLSGWRAPRRDAPAKNLVGDKYVYDEVMFELEIDPEDIVITGIRNLNDGSATPVSTTYYNTLGVASSTPWPGVNIQRQTMTDGTVVTTKVMH